MYRTELQTSTNGKYVYYMKDCGEYEGTLYGYKLGAEEPYKIASEVLCWNWTLFDIKLLISSINTAKNNQRSNI